MYVSSVYSICDDGGIIYVISFLISIILQLQNLAAVQVLHTIRLVNKFIDIQDLLSRQWLLDILSVT